MQTASMLRTNALVSSSRQCCNRQIFQPHFAPAVALRRRAVLIRAEADNTGGSITNSGQTKGKDSYEVWPLSDQASDHDFDLSPLTRLCKALYSLCTPDGKDVVKQFCGSALLIHVVSAIA